MIIMILFSDRGDFPCIIVIVLFHKLLFLFLTTLLLVCSQVDSGGVTPDAYHSPSVGSRSTSEKDLQSPKISQTVSGNTNQGESYIVNTPVDEMMSNKRIEKHNEVIVLTLQDLIRDMQDKRAFSENLWRIQNIHRHTHDEYKKILSKSLYRIFMEHIDTVLQKQYKKYKGKKQRAMRHFLECVYHSITYYMPKELIQPES